MKKIRQIYLSFIWSILNLLVIGCPVSPEYPEIHFNPVEVTPEWLNFGVEDMCITGDLALIAAGPNGLHFFDISDPEHPQWMKKIRTYHPVERVFARNGYAYIMTDTCKGQSPSKFIVLDIDPVEDAKQVAEIAFDVCLNEADMEGDLLYLQIGNATDFGFFDMEFIVIDVSQPDDPTIIASHESQIGLNPFKVVNGFLYTNTRWGILGVYDLNDPQLLTRVTAIPAGYRYNHFEITGGYGFIASWEPSQRDYNYTLEIVDLDPFETSDPIASLQIDGRPRKVFVNGDYAYLTDDEGMMFIVDVSDPESPVMVNEIEMPGFAGVMKFQGNYAYFGGANGIFVMDCTTIQSPEIIGSAPTIGASTAMGISGEVLYIFSTDSGFTSSIRGLNLYNISTPDEPKWEVSLLNSKVIESACIGDGLAYVGLSEQLYIFDISTLSEPVLLSTFELADPSSFIALEGEYVYINTGLKIVIIDIGDPRSPNLVRNVQLPFSIARSSHILVADGYAFVTKKYGSSCLVDIDPPEEAFVIGTISNIGDVHEIGVFLDRMYLSTHSDGIHVFDISGLPGIYEIGNYDTGKYHDSIHIKGRYAYVTADWGGFGIFDIFSPDSITLVQEVYDEYGANDIVVKDNYAYTCSWDGLKITRLYR